MSTRRSIAPASARVLADKNRNSLCSFTFSDGRRCRTPRQSGDSTLCAFHARKESQARASQEIGRDISYFFSGEYLSACDLNTALGRLFAAVAQGHIKPKTASTLAYLAQTMLQTIHHAQYEYLNAFSLKQWHQGIAASVKSNYDYKFPPAAQDSGHDPDHDEAPAQPAQQHPTLAALKNINDDDNVVILNDSKLAPPN